MLGRTRHFSKWAWSRACGPCRDGENHHLSCQWALDVSKWLEGENISFDHLVVLRNWTYTHRKEENWFSIHARLEHWVEEIERWV
jgi:hypothetical protein